MPSLRIGIDVGGTFTHGVVLRPPGEVVYRARVPTTHTAESGVAEGVRQVLARLLEHADARDIELVAHSTTQATNALLEGDVAPVILAAIVPPGEDLAVRQALPQGRLDLGGGHHVELTRVLIPWEDAACFELSGGAGVAARQQLTAELHAPLSTGRDTAATLALESRELSAAAPVVMPPASAAAQSAPVAVVQPLAGKHELREELVAAKYRALGHPVVCAADITQVLGLAARARTAVVNASMLPKMLATARFTAQAVGELLPGVPVQVVRSDGGAMSLAAMMRLPVLSLLSGPAAGASAALARSGLSNVVFIEVGGTSTDITLIKDGRVRHCYATVGGQRLLVPALDLRTVAVGGGSILCADYKRFGARSAHVAGLPYYFQSIAAGGEPGQLEPWEDPQSHESYLGMRMQDGTLAAITLTDYVLGTSGDAMQALAAQYLGAELSPQQCAMLAYLYADEPTAHRMEMAAAETLDIVELAIIDLWSANGVKGGSGQFRLVAGGGGAPAVVSLIKPGYVMLHATLPKDGTSPLIPDHAVISAIGAALAVSCVSLSKSVAEPGAADIAELTAEVERRLSMQGAERVSTDYEFDAQRQVLTVTGRGSQPYAQDARVQSQEELQKIANRLVFNDVTKVWQSDQLSLWRAESHSGQLNNSGNARSTLHEKQSINTFFKKLINKTEADVQTVLLNHYGQCLWQGTLRECWPALGHERETVLKHIIELRTQYTDGGPVLPGLALACAGWLIPLDQLASADLIAEVLRWEQLPPDADGCFLLRG
jgi:N-methylhydantoinase A